MCTHKVDIPLNAVVEVVLVDEGEWPIFWGFLKMVVVGTKVTFSMCPILFILLRLTRK